ncbi:MAG: RNA-binding protein [Oscillospiraceae bacterium]|nr:RNA-binding protein [Oscillospiraceae bacterium]
MRPDLSCLDAEQKLLIAHMKDLFAMRGRGRTCFSSFLSEGEAAVVRQYAAQQGEDVVFYGGYEGAGRVMAGMFPDYEEPSDDAFPMKRIFIGGRMTEGLTHRDYMGSILGLGIERSACGDIVTADAGAYVMLAPAAASLVMNELTKVGRVGVKCRECAADEKICRSDDIAYRPETVSSLRLDCVVSAAANLSREKSAALIRSGAVSVDHFPVTETSAQVAEKSLISVRGYGRFVLSEVGGTTKKNKIHITIGKYQ